MPSSHGVGSGAGPGGGGLSPLRLAGTSGGDFSEGCPCQPHAWMEVPFAPHGDNLFLGGLCGRGHGKDKDTTVGNFSLQVENPEPLKCELNSS